MRGHGRGLLSSPYQRPPKAIQFAMKTSTKPATRKAAPAKRIPSNVRKAVRFALAQPAASSVFLSGEFNDWNSAILPLTRDPEGVWSTEIDLLPGTHAYLFVVDGNWVPDPHAQSVPNPFGGSNSIIEVA
jgi:1,4-alpha-glucan branching enzyme